jgi:hypothetical protein
MCQPTMGQQIGFPAFVVVIDAKLAQCIALDPLIAFRWNERQHGFELVERSGLAQSRD